MPFSKVPHCAYTRVVLVPRDFCSSQAGMKYDRNSHFEVEPGHEFRWICATFLTGWGYVLAAAVLQNLQKVQFGNDLPLRASKAKNQRL